MRIVIVGVLGLSSIASIAGNAGAQSNAQRSCKVLCTPSVTLMPAMLRTHLFGGPLVKSLSTGAEQRLPSSSQLELIVAVASRSAIPRLSLFGSAQWFPNAAESRNPFTLYTASELGGHVRANAPTVTLGASEALLTSSETGGLADLAANVADLYSQAARPTDESAYTHKLDFELVTHVNAFAWTPGRTYVHRLNVFGILDYVAAGLPRAGDQVPKGRQFMADARPTSLIVGLSIPLTPPTQ